MEGVAAFPAAVDIEAGLVTLVIAERGASSALAARLEPGEPVALLGPNGSALDLPQGGAMLLAGAGFGLAALAPIAQAARAKGTRLLLFAEANDGLTLPRALAPLADHAIWCDDSGKRPQAVRAQDHVFAGSLAQAIEAYGKGGLGPCPIPLAEIDRVVAIGPDGLLASLDAASRNGLASLLKPETRITGALLSPMQCMMKEICARCLQPMRDPASGRTRLVFACSDPLQPLALADLAAYSQRLAQDEVPARLGEQWLAFCLAGA